MSASEPRAATTVGRDVDPGAGTGFPLKTPAKAQATGAIASLRRLACAFAVGRQSFQREPKPPGELRSRPSLLKRARHIRRYLRDKLGYLSEAAASDLPIVPLGIQANTFLLNAADDIKWVLEGNYPNYDKTHRMISAQGRRISGQGLLTAVGAEHLKLRKLLQPMYNPRSIAGLAKPMVEVSLETMRTWRDGQEIDIAAAMSDLAQGIVGRLLFSADFAGADAGLAEAIRVRRRYIEAIYGSLLPAPHVWPTRINRQYAKALKVIDDNVYRLIAERKQQPREDMLSMLLAIRDEDGRPLSDRLIRDEAVTVSITGYETIGEGLGWTCWLLARHPQVAQAMADELKTVLGSVSEPLLSVDAATEVADPQAKNPSVNAVTEVADPRAKNPRLPSRRPDETCPVENAGVGMPASGLHRDRPPTLADIPRLDLTHRVLQESLRLYPPTWIYIRMAREADTLPSGRRIPAGAKLYVCPYTMQRKGQFYPDPERFDPGRFDDGIRQSRPKYAYFPFGGGPRVCIGQHIAKMLGVLVLATTFQKWGMDLLPGQTITPVPDITLRPTPGIRVRLRHL